ncbi:MAG: hypothetical protein ABWZ40_00125 [Caulobacterales bacterium]
MDDLQRQTGLAAFIDRADGIDAEEALSRADLHLAAMKDKVHKSLADSVQEIGALIGDAAPSEPDMRRLYHLSDGVLSVASLYGKEALGRAAYSLCDLLHAFGNQRCWNAAAVRLHHDAMRLLQAAPHPSADDSAHLLRGLEKVVAAFAPQRRMADA